MKRIAFVISIILISLLSVCKAQNNVTASSETARQFGYYVAFGDNIKAAFNIVPEADITEYVSQTKNEIEQLGGLKDIIVDNEEIVSAKEAVVTLTYICRKEDAKVQKTYTLLKVGDDWKISADKL